MHLDMWLERFPWTGDVQKKGFLNFTQWMRSLGTQVKDSDEDKFRCLVAYFVQKDHESHEWWVDTVGAQVKSLQEQLRLLQEQITALKSNQRA